MSKLAVCISLIAMIGFIAGCNSSSPATSAQVFTAQRPSLAEQYAQNLNYQLAIKHGGDMKAYSDHGKSRVVMVKEGNKVTQQVMPIKGEVLHIRCEDSVVLNPTHGHFVGKIEYTELGPAQNGIQLQPGYTTGDVECAEISLGIRDDEETQLEMHNAGFVWVVFEAPTWKDGWDGFPIPTN